jgi:hypothetical protein
LSPTRLLWNCITSRTVRLFRCVYIYIYVCIYVCIYIDTCPYVCVYIPARPTPSGLDFRGALLCGERCVKMCVFNL